MTEKEVAAIVQSVLIECFNVEEHQFDLDQVLEHLQDEFKILSNLVRLEQLLNKEINKNIPILENISTSFHTPRDIVKLIMQEL